MFITLALFAPALAPVDPLPGGDALVAYSKRVGAQTTAYAELEGPAGAPFVLFASLADAPASSIDLDEAVPIGDGYFDGAGRATVAVPVNDTTLFPAGTQFSVAAAYAHQGQVWLGNTAPLPISETADSIPLDFDFAPGFDEPVAGQTIVGDYVDIGLVIGAVNGGGGPNQAIIFDSSNPTGGDDDLATPGPGLGNGTALGNLLIIAENAVDADNDGLVDVPDDERDGGDLLFSFANPTQIDSVTVVDIDDAGLSEIRVTQVGVPGVTTYPLVDVGDNGVQTVILRLEGIVTMDVDLGGSGAIGEIMLAPCPFTVDFNETATGKPLDFPAGTEVTDQYQNSGLTFSALSATAGGPNKCIIFDSGNPTGGDFDLGTPGYGINNDQFLGNLLIIAENDVDADNDGLVDDPDDNEEGGIIFMNWDENIRLLSFKVIDVDSPEIDVVRLFDENNLLILEADLGPIGDNSVQEFSDPAGVSGVRRAELIFTGSGGVDSIRWCPDDEDDKDDSTSPQ